MNKEDNNFEEFLRSKLENHTLTVSDSVWANIEKKQKKREKFIWFKQYLNVFLALDIAFVLGLSAFTFLNTNDVQSKNKVKAASQIEAKTPLNIASSTQEDMQVPVKSEPIIHQTIAPKETEDITKPGPQIKTTNPKAVASNHIESAANKGILAHKNNETSLTKQSKKQTVNRVNETKNLPLHQQITGDNNAPNQPVYASLTSLALHPLSREFITTNELNQGTIEFEALPPSIVQSKSKKVIKAEQKAVAQENKAKAKQAEEAQKAIAKQEETKTENATNTTASETLAANSNQEAPLALDTVYGKKKFKGYFAIDVLLSPEIAGRTLKGNTEQLSSYISRRDSAEKTQIAYSALMRMNLFINRNVFINTGISYSQRKEKFSIEHKWQTHEDYIDSSKFITIVDPFVGNIIYKTYDTLDYVRTHKEILNHNLTMTFVDVPAMIGYKWLGKKAGMAVQAGVIFNLMFKQKGSIANFNYTANDVALPNQNPFNTNAGLSLAGGISSNYRLSDKLDLMIEPHTRYTLKSIHNSTYPLQQKLFSYGLNVGLRLKL